MRRAAAGALGRASWSATSAASRSAASASCRARSSAAGARSSASATPRSPRPNRSAFRRPQVGGVLTLLVEGAHAPLIQHLDAADHRAGQPLLRLCGHRPDRVPRRASRPRRRPGPQRPQLRPVPKDLGEGLREIADPELRACLELLARKLPLPAARLRSPRTATEPIPVINRSELNPMKSATVLACAVAALRARRLQQEQGREPPPSPTTT